jgi:hypothetical protein
MELLPSMGTISLCPSLRLHEVEQINFIGTILPYTLLSGRRCNTKYLALHIGHR